MSGSSDVKISALPSVSALTGAEVTPVVVDGTTRRTTMLDAVRLMAAKRAGLLFDTLSQATSLVSVLSLPIGSIIATGGYAVAGDGGDALYCRVVSPPSHAGKWQDSAGNWWELKSRAASPEAFGAKGDGSADDTTPLQGILDYLPPGGIARLRGGAEYRATNLMIPNGGGAGRQLVADGLATIRAIAGGSNKYLVATQSYVQNLTFVGSPISCTNIIFDANSLKERAFAICAFYGLFTGCYFKGGTVASCDLTETTIDGVTNAPSVVDNIFIACVWSNASGSGFRNALQTQDFQIIGGRSFSNGGYGFDIESSAGMVMTGVQVYANTAGAARFKSVGFQDQIRSNNFDGSVEIATMSPSVNAALFGSNTIKDGDLICTMGGANPSATLVLESLRLQGTARIIHNYNSASRNIIVNGGVSESPNPLGWNFANPTGIITANHHYSVAAGGFLNGVIDPRGTAYTGDRAPNVLRLQKSLAAATSTAVVVSATLSTEQTAGTHLEVDIAVSMIDGSFTNLRVYRSRVFAGVTRKQSSSGSGNYVSVQDLGSSVSSGISVAGAWVIDPTPGAMAATLTLTITHNTPNSGQVVTSVTGNHRFVSSMTIA